MWELRDLARAQSTEWVVTEASAQFCLASPRFDMLSEPDEVRSAADQLLRVIRGAAKIGCGVFPRVEIAGIVRLGHNGKPVFRKCPANSTRTAASSGGLRAATLPMAPSRRPASGRRSDRT